MINTCYLHIFEICFIQVQLPYQIAIQEVMLIFPHSDGRDDASFPVISVMESSILSVTDGNDALPVGSGSMNLPAPI